MPRERLAKAVASTGAASRRQAEEWIRAGRITVDGQVVDHPAALVDPDLSTIAVDGRPLIRPPLRYLLYYKPPGVVTTRADPHARSTVAQVLGPVAHGLYPVGRLDKASEGLLLLTNDGAVALVLTHPRYQVEKTYRVWTARPLLRRDLARMAKGVQLEDGWARPRRLRMLTESVIELTLVEGRKREIRRLFAALGYRVTRLVRVKIGPLPLGNLRPGEWRELTAEEGEALRQWVGRVSAPIGS